MAALEQIVPLGSPKDLENRVIEWTERVYDEADQELLNARETKVTGKLIDYIEGRQWSAKARYGRSRPVVNRMFRHFIETVGLLTDLELDFSLKFTDRAPDKFSQIEELMNRMIVDWAFGSDFEMELAAAVMYGLINYGPAKVQWNPDLCDGMGDVEFVPLSPLNFLTIGSTKNIQKDAEVCIYRQPVTIQALIRKHGEIAKDVKPDPVMSEMPGQRLKPARFSKGQWGAMSPTLRNLLGEKAEGIRSTYPRVMRKEFWIRDDATNEKSETVWVGERMIQGYKIRPFWAYAVEPGEKLYPRGRVIVTAGGKVLEDCGSPYWHGKLPFGIFRAFPVPWKFAGLTPLEPIAAMQAILNRIRGGVLDTVYAAIEPTLMGPKAAFSQQDWDTMDTGQFGGKIAYQNKTPRPPEWRTPPQLANYVAETMHDIEREMDMNSGASAIQQTLNKKQIPGGDTLDTILNSRSVNIRFMSRSLKSFLGEIGTLTASTMLQFYGAERRVTKYGMTGLVANDFEEAFGQWVPHGMEPEKFVRKANFTIRKGSLLGIEKAEKMPVVFALRKGGDLSRRRMFTFLDANFDLDKNDKELKEEMAEKAAIAAAAGAMKGGGHKK